MVAKLRLVVDVSTACGTGTRFAQVSKNIEQIQHDSGVRVWVIDVARIDAKFWRYIGAWLVERFVVCLEYITMREYGSAQRGLAHSLWSVISAWKPQETLPSNCSKLVADSIRYHYFAWKKIQKWCQFSKTLIPSNCLRLFDTATISEGSVRYMYCS
jgi:hypothetical protein